MTMDTTWPERDAIERWWRAHTHELALAVTEERVRLQTRIEELEAIIDDCDMCRVRAGFDREDATPTEGD